MNTEPLLVTLKPDGTLPTRVEDRIEQLVENLAGGSSGGILGVALALSDHVSATTDVHGIPDTAPIVELNDLPDLALRFENGLV